MKISFKEALKDNFNIYLFKKYNRNNYCMNYKNGKRLAKIIKQLNYHESVYYVKLKTDFYNNIITITINDVDKVMDDKTIIEDKDYKLYEEIMKIYKSYQEQGFQYLSMSSIFSKKELKDLSPYLNNYNTALSRNGFIKGLFKKFGHFHKFRYFNSLKLSIIRNNTCLEIEIF